MNTHRLQKPPLGFRLLGTACLALLTTSAARAQSTPADAARLVSEQYRHRLIQQLSVADDRAAGWVTAIDQAPPSHRDALAFLLSNMPEQDLKNLPPAGVLSDIALAYNARAATPWAKAVPEEVFLNDVLPYANTSEARDPWRADFRTRFAPSVKDCKTAADAAQLLNREIFKTLGVVYHATKRQKPDQSPKESMAIGYASCTGLAILLVDACRSVGVPARIAGTPMWSDDSGNHTWVEIYDAGRWHFIGAAEPGPLDDTWFKDKAAKADASRPQYRIYAASFKKTDVAFPSVWAKDRTDLYAEDVTSRYAAVSTGTVANTLPLTQCSPPTTQSAASLDGDWAKMAGIVPRGYVCRRANGPIEITGRGDSPAWQQAAWSDNFVDIEGFARPAPRFRTSLKMLWDDQYFYVFAQMREPHVWGTITKKNSIIFVDNDFEIFIDPDGDHHRYHEFEVNALNTIWELTLPKPYRDDGHPIDADNVRGLKSAVHIDGTLNDPRDTDKGWSVEVAIPWNGLAEKTGAPAEPPQDGQQWRVNFSRVEWLVDIIDGQYHPLPKAMRDEDNWVWSPIGVIDMHRPERWGVVQFSAGPATANYRPDPTNAQCDRLNRVYYRQKSFFKTNGRYATTADELALTLDQRQGLTLAATGSGFVATIAVAGDAPQRLSIDQTSRIDVQAGK